MARGDILNELQAGSYSAVLVEDFFGDDNHSNYAYGLVRPPFYTLREVIDITFSEGVANAAGKREDVECEAYIKFSDDRETVISLGVHGEGIGREEAAQLLWAGLSNIVTWRQALREAAEQGDYKTMAKQLDQ